MGLVYSIHGARKRAQNACLSSFCLSHFLSFNGLSAPRSLSGRGGHKTPSITSDLRSMASFRALILGFRHLPSTKVGLASCWSFNTTSGILRAIADTCMRRAQTLIHTCHASRCGLLKSPTHTRLLGWRDFGANLTPTQLSPQYTYLTTWWQAVVSCRHVQLSPCNTHRPSQPVSFIICRQRMQLPKSPQIRVQKSCMRTYGENSLRL